MTSEKNEVVSNVGKTKEKRLDLREDSSASLAMCSKLLDELSVSSKNSCPKA